METPERLTHGARGASRPGLVHDAPQRSEAPARDEPLGLRRQDHGRQTRPRLVHVQPYGGSAGAVGAPEREDGDVCGRLRPELHRHGRAHDLVPGPGRREQDDDAESEQDAEQQGGPGVEAPKHCAQKLHFTGLNEVARPIMRSLDSWLSSVLRTQKSVPLRFQATMCRWSAW